MQLRCELTELSERMMLNKMWASEGMNNYQRHAKLGYGYG